MSVDPDESDMRRLVRLLERTGYESKSKEFAEVLERFKEHPEALKALRRGVARQGRGVDSGSYCESPSRDYGDWVRKQEMLDKLDLADDRAFLAGVDPARLPSRAPANKNSPGGDTLAELKEQVRELTERVATLEKRAIRGPVVKSGPNGP
jgi:hypothetical protein